MLLLKPEEKQQLLREETPFPMPPSFNGSMADHRLFTSNRPVHVSLFGIWVGDTYLRALTICAATCLPSPNPKTDVHASSKANIDYQSADTITKVH
jgi:hypothetical protein